MVFYNNWYIFTITSHILCSYQDIVQIKFPTYITSFRNVREGKVYVMTSNMKSSKFSAFRGKVPDSHKIVLWNLFQ